MRVAPIGLLKPIGPPDQVPQKASRKLKQQDGGHGSRNPLRSV
jgi:hypothetical protein